MASELADGVYAFELTLSRDGREAAFHPGAVETDRGLVLLDVGYPDTLDDLEAELDAIGRGWGDVWAAVITHHDADHAAALSAVVERADPVRLAHPDCAPYVDGRLEPIKGDGDRYPPVAVDVEVADGTTVRTAAGPMEIIHTPGHTPGHVALHLPEPKLLFAADALTASAGELAGPNEEFTPNLPQAIESVGRLAEEDIERTVCFHGGVVDQGTGMIARLWQELAEEP
jgi:glyoxylase-like metal-dependent hydrolase (beta-lactamase superfamily II)